MNLIAIFEGQPFTLDQFLQYIDAQEKETGRTPDTVTVSRLQMRHIKADLSRHLAFEANKDVNYLVGVKLELEPQLS